MAFPRKIIHKFNECGPNVRRIRVEKLWSQEKLALKCQISGWDISRETVSKIEGRRRVVADFELQTLAKILEVSILDLLPS